MQLPASFAVPDPFWRIAAVTFSTARCFVTTLGLISAEFPGVNSR
jgi:hypothetical protein